MTSFSFEIPTVETERLILRAPREADLDAVSAFMQSERSHIIGGPMDRVACWKLIAGNIGHWALRGYGFWNIESRANGEMVGACGFIFREGWSEPELGWNLHDGYEGQGIAFEAASAARSYGATHFGLDGVISHIDPKNERSIALATRLGARFEKSGALLGHDIHIYRHPKQGDTA